MKSYSGPVKWLGVSFAAIGALVLCAMIYSFLTVENYADPGALLVPIVFILAGVGLVVVSRRMTSEDPIDVGVVVGAIFMGFGVLMMIGGIVLTIEDPSGLFLVAFGGVFGAVGFFASKAFGVPEGKKRVAVQSQEASQNIPFGGHRRVSSTTFITVDEDATEEEVEAARKSWVSDALDEREDWQAGRIMQEARRHGGNLKGFAIGMGVLVVIFLIVGIFVEPFFYFFAFGCTIVGSIVGGTLVMQTIRARKFGASYFLMDPLPIAPGDTLKGVIEAEMDSRSVTDGRFTLLLECKHTMRYNQGDRTRYRTTVQWSEEIIVEGDPGPPVRIPVEIAVPGDLAGATLRRMGGSGHSWELTATAASEGVDYRAAFTLPIIDRAMIQR